MKRGVSGIGVAAALLLAALLTMLPGRPALAYEAKDSDAFFLEFGDANIEVRNSPELLSGDSLRGGLRLGLFWTFFLELGYGRVHYSDTVPISGVKTDIDFRTTGANYGLGLMIPIRKVRLGLKYVRSPNNRWSEVQKDNVTGTQLSAIKGNINFDSEYVFTQFGEKNWFEIGVRRDLIRNTTSVLENSFGPYIAFNIPLS